MNTISNQILQATSWGRNQALSLPVVGMYIRNQMVALDKTSMKAEDILDFAYDCVCLNLGFEFNKEFDNLMKYQTTMINKSTAQSILRQYWEAVNQELRSNPDVFNLVKDAVIYVNSTLIQSNSRPKMIRSFKAYIIDNGYSL